MPARKKGGSSKKSAGKKKAAKKPVKKAPRKPVKKAVKKKASPKKAAKAKKASKGLKSAKPAVPPLVTAEEDIQPVTGPICLLRGTRWFCMKPDGDGHLVVCDGPFTTKQDCEENAVCG